MGKQPVRMKAVVYALSPFQQKVMPGLFKDLPGKISHKFSSSWMGATLLLGPLVGTYSLMSSSKNTENRKDPGWNYAKLNNPKDTNAVECVFCGKVLNEEIYRLTHILVGGHQNAKACPKCPEHMRTEIQEFMSKKEEVK